MTRSEIEQTYHVTCEKMRNPYNEGREFWTVKDSVTKEELGRGATLDDVYKTLSIIKDNNIY